MKTSYAVKWREAAGQTFLGRLEFTADALVLEGRHGSENAVMRTVAFNELRGFHLADSAAERLDGQATLVVERREGDYLVTSSLVHAGVVQELVDRLSKLHRAGAASPDG
jgi:hypothetical protein